MRALIAGWLSGLVSGWTAGVAAWATDQAIVQHGGDSVGVLVFQLARGLVPRAAGVVAYLLAAWVLRAPELRAMLARDSEPEF